ncbi:hypothetical protein ACSBR1_027805 [Camellia fascicularis]
MSNESLDTWIFQRHQELTLGWQPRKKIIMVIAKGLTYLHEECRQKIFHLDIKPQNILLDECFNVKISDFGLSKLIDKDQSQVVTMMRGTPGYLAPEWLSSIITEKVDAYSFGVVVLEMLCGRKNLDRSQPEEDMHLLGLFKRKVEEEQLLDIVDKYNYDMQTNRAKVVEMMRVAAWSLQSNLCNRLPNRAKHQSSPTVGVVHSITQFVSGFCSCSSLLLPPLFHHRRSFSHCRRPPAPEKHQSSPTVRVVHSITQFVSGSCSCSGGASQEVICALMLLYYDVWILCSAFSALYTSQQRKSNVMLLIYILVLIFIKVETWDMQIIVSRELKSVYVRNLPSTISAVDIELEFKTFGRILPYGVFIGNRKKVSNNDKHKQ